MEVPIEDHEAILMAFLASLGTSRKQEVVDSRGTEALDWMDMLQMTSVHNLMEWEGPKFRLPTQESQGEMNFEKVLCWYYSSLRFPNGSNKKRDI